MRLLWIPVLLVASYAIWRFVSWLTDVKSTMGDDDGDHLDTTD
jgi:hypothetical protein